MSSLVISGDTSGSVTLQAPAVAGSTILTLPATSGTVITSASGTAATATNLAGGSNGTIPYQSAAGTTQMLAVGSAGQVLTSAGAGAPTWSAPSSGAMTFISVQTVSGTPSTLDFTSGIDSTYDDYMVIFEDVAFSASTKLCLQIRKSGSFQAVDYNYGIFYLQFSGSSSNSTSTGDVNSILSWTSLSTNRRSGFMYLYNANSTTAWAQGITFQSQSVGSSTTGTNNNLAWGGSTQGTAAAVTGLRFYPESGTFTSGTFRLYGIQKS